MSYPLVIRLVIAMTLMPDASYCGVLARPAGLVADIPFALEWHVPTEKVVTDWRALVNVTDTPENRKEFGCTGTASQEGEAAGPFLRIGIVALTAWAGRAMLGVICGRARAGEQTLLARTWSPTA